VYPNGTKGALPPMCGIPVMRAGHSLQETAEFACMADGFTEYPENLALN